MIVCAACPGKGQAAHFFRGCREGGCEQQLFGGEGAG